MKRKTVRELRQLAFDEMYRVAAKDSSLAIDRSFPEEFANQLSQIESFNKHLFRPNTYLHKWWARRCGSTFRTILKQFVPVQGRRDYYAAGGLEGKIVLDPMMGGGTTLHEAIRLGANVIGVDIDPIPVVQARATLTQVALKDLQTAFNQFFSDLYREVGSYFQTECPHCQQVIDSQYTLYGLRKVCACGEVVQIEQYELRHEDSRIIRIWPENWEVSDRTSTPHTATSKVRLITKSETTCRTCGQKYQELLDVPYYARYIPIAIAGSCPDHGLFFRAPGASDMNRLRAANEERQRLNWLPLEDFLIQDGPKSGDLVARNIRSYLDVFSSRQLLYLHHSIDLLQSYHGIVKLNLALLVSTSLEFNSLLCGYKGADKRRPGAIRHVFALHAYSFPYTAAENNPLNQQKTSGNLQILFRDRIARGRKWAIAPIERRVSKHGDTELVTIPGEFDGGIEAKNEDDLDSGQQKFLLVQGDSQHLPIHKNHSVDLVVTDPPYYDNVQYSDLAAFFRVWLARLIPEEADWTYEHGSSAVAHKANGGDTNFMQKLSGIFLECKRVLKKNGRMVFTFHHWDPNAWAELTISLKQAGFQLVNVYVVFSENPVSVHINNLNAIKHDCILVLAPENETNQKHWRLPKLIATDNSEDFCRQCGETVGWLLSGPGATAEIRATWNHLIPSRQNGNNRVPLEYPYAES